jgi:hypothetical protein
MKELPGQVPASTASVEAEVPGSLAEGEQADSGNSTNEGWTKAG